MNVVFDVSKAILMVGIAAGIIILCNKVSPEGAKEALCKAADAVGFNVESANNIAASEV